MRVHASHPQVHKVELVQTAYVFECPGCGGEFYVRSARVQPDGTLRCSRCSETEPTPNGRYNRPVSYHWCPQCRQAKPWREFESDRSWPLPKRHPWCLECAAKDASKPVKPTKTCAHCEAEFTPSRRDARYCSGRCRVAAHRSA